jgi:hypothetical protein
MTDSVDIFRLEASGVLWLESAGNLECAQVRVQELAASSPGQYVVLDHETGKKHVINLDGMQGRSAVVNGSR